MLSPAMEPVVWVVSRCGRAIKQADEQFLDNRDHTMLKYTGSI
jgi:hypothetical protein